MDYSYIPAAISFAVIFGYGLFRFLTHPARRKSATQIFSIKLPFYGIAPKIKDFILSADFPFAVDVAVAHLGNEPVVYVTVNDRNIGKVRQRLHGLFGGENVMESDGYIVLYSAGVYDALHAKMSKDEFESFDLLKLNFSEVNEIGEGLAFRFHNAEQKESVGVDVIFSAPSQFQLREIRDSAGEALRGYGYGRPKDVPNFVSDFNYHAFLRK